MSHKLCTLIVLVFLSVLLVSCGTSENPDIGEIYGIPEGGEVISGQVYQVHISPTGQGINWLDIGWTSNHTSDLFGAPTALSTTYVPSDVSTETEAQIVCAATPEGMGVQTTSVQFSIVPASPVKSITVIFPNGGENIYKNAGTTITWSSQNVQGNVKIEYSTDNFDAVKIELAADAPNTGSWVWFSIGVDATNTARIRITSLDDPSVSDISDAVFNVIDMPN